MNTIFKKEVGYHEKTGSAHYKEIVDKNRKGRRRKKGTVFFARN